MISVCLCGVDVIVFPKKLIYQSDQLGKVLLQMQIDQTTAIVSVVPREFVN